MMPQVFPIDPQVFPISPPGDIWRPGIPLLFPMTTLFPVDHPGPKSMISGQNSATVSYSHTVSWAIGNTHFIKYSYNSITVIQEIQ